MPATWQSGKIWVVIHSDWKILDLISLVRRRYDDWNGFDHPEFVADEIIPKQATIHKARDWLNQVELDRLIAEADYDTFIERLDKIGRDNNLLWRQVPSSGDTAILYQKNLDRPTFCTQVRNLLYADRPSPDRLQTFADYAAAHNLPNKWPFPTYFLFICHPETELFVRPRPAEWFLKYMDGRLAKRVTGAPTAATYATILTYARELLEELRPYGAADMVDVQSFLWVCAREGREVVGRLDTKGQIELGVPVATADMPLTYDVAYPMAALRESADGVEDDTAEPGAGEVVELPPVINEPYTLADCAAETGVDEASLARWVQAIHRKGQAIFYGPPGTGKTFLAEKLARHLIAGGDGFAELVQFHSAYSYEDFVQGIRPVTQPDGTLHYELVPGHLLRFCARAAACTGLCVLIIDELNRANVAAVFGELMYLLEYREHTIPLAAGGVLRIPANVRLLATMNTADRSIALVDHALRRRFAFIHLAPNYDLLRRYHAQTGFPVERLITVLRRLNDRIGDPHYQLGHSFFLRPDLAEQLSGIWQMEIEPYLEEYFFDQAGQVDEFRWEQVREQIRES